MARYLVSHRLSGSVSPDARRQSRGRLDEYEAKFAAFSELRSAPQPAAESARRILIVEGEPRELEARRKELPPDLILEPELFRTPAVFRLASAFAPPTPAPAGLGNSIQLRILSGGAPVRNAQVSLLLSNLRGGSNTSVFDQTDQNGVAELPYDASFWYPRGAAILPEGGVWSWWLASPIGQQQVTLPPLPKTGPFGWWHRALGQSRFSETSGQGIRIGIADTGCGPNTNVAHVQSAGAFLNGSQDSSPNAMRDVAMHGTHVAGIIGARPQAGSGDFAGIAPGADIRMARIYPGGGPPGMESGTASNGDIANALDELSDAHAADIINLSLGGEQPSEIEADALLAAIERGSLVICAAGNGSGRPVLYPAAYPQAVAVSAIGLLGTIPNGSLDTLTIPGQPDRYTGNGAYVPAFVNVGPEIKCSGPGVGIISTVPGNGAPYAAMSGTSMATPAVTGALATVLSGIPQYRQLARGRQRAQMAWAVLAQTFRTLGLNFNYQGYGLTTARSG